MVKRPFQRALLKTGWIYLTSPWKFAETEHSDENTYTVLSQLCSVLCSSNEIVVSSLQIPSCMFV